jgi:hypothetical protein
MEENLDELKFFCFPVRYNPVTLTVWPEVVDSLNAQAGEPPLVGFRNCFSVYSQKPSISGVFLPHREMRLAVVTR